MVSKPTTHIDQVFIFILAKRKEGKVWTTCRSTTIPHQEEEGCQATKPTL